MKLAILETGKPPADLIPAFGRYPAMFEELLGDDFDYTSIDVQNEPLPPDVHRFDAYLITGSSAGVYEDHAWIDPLKTFIRAAYRKIGATRRSQAVRWGMEHGFVPDRGRVVVDR